MTKNPAQRARQKAAKENRRKAIVAEKRKGEVVSKAASLARQVAVAAQGPIRACRIMPILFEEGIGQLVLARQLPSGLAGVAFFLIDTYCLGVKDVFYREASLDEVEDRLAAMGDFVEYDPACARRLVNEAAAYAADLDLPPPPDLKLIEPLFGDIDMQTCQQVFTFGKDGKPFYITGPSDTPAKVRKVLAALERTAGPGRYGYLVGGRGFPV